MCSEVGLRSSKAVFDGDDHHQGRAEPRVRKGHGVRAAGAAVVRLDDRRREPACGRRPVQV